MARDSSFAEEEEDKSGYSMLVNSGSLRLGLLPFQNELHMWM